MEFYDHKKIEKKWQEKWEESGIYNVGDRDESKEKEYVLVEWPYPSGNLHIGHWFAFAVVDIYVRAHRMQGKQVLFPMGFDAFGLPAENAAIKRSLDPKEWTEKNVEYMKKQLRSMGNAFSWDKTTSSTDPEYYKWTQWMFTQFFEKDIAYRGKGIVNWCPSCNTVLANEQLLPDDTCERCGNTVEKKQMDEWKMRITKYADRLIDDLDTLDWPENIKRSQKNWIGRSRGARIDFKIKNLDKNFTVFTTRPDTLFGATYCVLAPEHKLVSELKEQIENWDEVVKYVRNTSKRSEIERKAEGREKSGVKLEGIKAINPVNKEEIPIFIADYVLAEYGTGAIMAVPAHDERDFEFAEKFNLPVKNVIKRLSFQTLSSSVDNDRNVYTGNGELVNSGKFDGMNSEEAKKAITEFVGGEITSNYRLRDWSVGRQRYWGVPIPIVYDPDGKAHSIPKELLPWTLPNDVDFKPTGEPPLAKSKELVQRTEKTFGKGWKPEVETMDTFVDSSWYFLRYFDNKNNREFSSIESQKKWMPVDIYFGGAEHTTMHLLYSRFWCKALLDLGLVTENEPYKKRINRGLVLGPDGNKMSKSKGNVIDPDEQVERIGADTVKMYLAFMGPYGEEANYPWNMGGIAGIRRFLEHVYILSSCVSDVESIEIVKQLHKTIKKVSGDIEQYKFNTAISSMMVFINMAEKTKISIETYKTFLKLLAPFAPHLADELWEKVGERKSIHTETWSAYEEALTIEDIVTIVIQVNGKVRGEIEMSRGGKKEDIENVAQNVPHVKKWIGGLNILKIIYVPDRLINFVTQSI